MSSQELQEPPAQVLVPQPNGSAGSRAVVPVAAQSPATGGTAAGRWLDQATSAISSNLHGSTIRGATARHMAWCRRQQGAPPHSNSLPACRRCAELTVVVDAVDQANPNLGMVVGHQDDVKELLAVRIELPKLRVHRFQRLQHPGTGRLVSPGTASEGHSAPLDITSPRAGVTSHTGKRLAWRKSPSRLPAV